MLEGEEALASSCLHGVHYSPPDHLECRLPSHTPRRGRTWRARVSGSSLPQAADVHVQPADGWCVRSPSQISCTVYVKSAAGRRASRSVSFDRRRTGGRCRHCHPSEWHCAMEARLAASLPGQRCELGEIVSPFSWEDRVPGIAGSYCLRLSGVIVRRRALDLLPRSLAYFLLRYPRQAKGSVALEGTSPSNNRELPLPDL